MLLPGKPAYTIAGRQSQGMHRGSTPGPSAYAVRGDSKLLGSHPNAPGYSMPSSGRMANPSHKAPGPGGTLLLNFFLCVTITGHEHVDMWVVLTCDNSIGQIARGVGDFVWHHVVAMKTVLIPVTPGSIMTNAAMKHINIGSRVVHHTFIHPSTKHVSSPGVRSCSNPIALVIQVRYRPAEISIIMHMPGKACPSDRCMQSTRLRWQMWDPGAA